MTEEELFQNIPGSAEQDVDSLNGDEDEHECSPLVTKRPFANSSIVTKKVIKRRISVGNKLRIKKKSPVKKATAKRSRLSSTLTSQSEILATPTAKAPPANHKLSTKSLSSITKPISPKLRAAKRISIASSSKAPTLSTEEIAFKKIEQEKKVEQLKIQKAKRLYQKLKSNGFQSTAKSTTIPTKKATIPKPPVSILDKRHGAKIPSNLKKSPVKKSTKRTMTKSLSQPTIPEPFNFATDVRLNHTSAHQHDDKLATSLTAGELAEKFMRDPRSHYVPETAAQKLTKPVSPKLQTEVRSKSTKKDRPLSRDELEDKFMEIQQKNAFKARTLDRRIFDSRGEFGVPKVPVKPLTIPMDIELRTEKRASTCQTVRQSSLEEAEEEHFEFKARPIPVTLKQPEKVATPPCKTNFKPTIAISPKLHSLERALLAPTRRQRPHHSVVEQEKKLQQDAARKSTLPMKLTQPKEFNLETSNRGEMYKEKMEEQLERERKEVMKAFKAQPMPNLAKSFQPKIEHKDPTIPEPFQLQSIQLHEESLQAFAHEIEEERKKNENLFKAKPVPKTLFEAKQPLSAVENKPHQTTVPLPVHLESEQRAKKRQEYDELLQKKKLAEESTKEEMMKSREDQENQHLKELRRKSSQEGGYMFKAAPICKEDLYPVKTSPRAKPPTIPKSPAFKLKERRQSQQNQMDTPMVDRDHKQMKMAAALRTL